MRLIPFVLSGILFGIILIKAEVVSWFRIQEMFRFQAFHMYGVIGSALAVAIISTLLIKKFKLKTVSGEEIVIGKKPLLKTGNLAGGTLFGLGWALTGACPGPLYALVGNGYLIILFVILGAMLGTFTYGLVRDKLPH